VLLVPLAADRCDVNGRRHSEDGPSLGRTRYISDDHGDSAPRPALARRGQRNQRNRLARSPKCNDPDSGDQRFLLASAAKHRQRGCALVAVGTTWLRVADWNHQRFDRPSHRCRPSVHTYDGDLDAALGDHVLVVYGTCIVVAVLALLFFSRIIPLLERHRYLRWASSLMASVRRVLFGRAAPALIGLGLAVHALTILALWCIGRAQGLMLPVGDAAILFVVVVGAALLPISIGGWGVRELAIVSLLGRHGLPAEQALLFSVCFGIVLAISALPGGVAWLFYAGSAPKLQPR
jgi:Lysylphosphatidylglycerol synthase TM region